MTTITVDAKGKRLGRLAAEVAHILMGKNSTEFVRNAVIDQKVSVSNIQELDIPAKKLSYLYQRYSGYPGGRKTEKRGNLIERAGIEHVFTKTVYGMLPKNRLRKEMLSRIEFVK